MARASRGNGRPVSSSHLLKRGVIAGMALVALTAASVVHASLGTPSETSATELYTRLSLELEARLHARDPAQNAVITLGPGGRDVRLWGELTEGTAERLADLIETNRGVERIHLTSEGGLVDEGEAIGRLVARYGLVTYVPDYCVSACTLAFVRGRERIIVASTRLGFHAPYEEGLFGQDFPADSTSERAAYLAAGVEAEFVDAALKVRSEDIWIPEPDHLLKARVATAVVDLDRFPDSTLDDGPDLAHARATILRNFTLLRSVERVAPSVIDAIAADYLDAYRNGASEAAVVKRLKRSAAIVLTRAVREADDATLVGVGQSLLKAMRRTADATSCSVIGSDADLIPAFEASRRTGDGEARQLVESAVMTSVTTPADRRAPQRLGAVLTRQERRFSNCALLVRRYAEALVLPRRAAARALREILLLEPAPPRVLEATARP